jgi:uroporphyrinogen decarboxylase
MVFCPDSKQGVFKMEFQPDYRNVELAARNRRPPRLPLYEHFINDDSIERFIHNPLAGLVHGDQNDRVEYFRRVCEFWKSMTYDTVSFEVCTCEIFPGGGALLGERPGPIQTKEDFLRYPWAELPERFWKIAAPRFEALREVLPPGMKAVGGIGNGPFEISEDLVGYEKLCYMQVDDPELFARLYEKIGEFLVVLWTRFMAEFADLFAVCRMGDDMGFKTATLLAPQTLIEHVVPTYRKIIAVIHGGGKPYLQHSCGNIFSIMDSLIDAGIDAKHSNEDVIAPFDHWIIRYGNRIAFFGGIDTDRLCRLSPDDVYRTTLEDATRFRNQARGFALGSGNSIPAYVPTEAYLAMIRAAREIRRREGTY